MEIHVVDSCTVMFVTVDSDPLLDRSGNPGEKAGQLERKQVSPLAVLTISLIQSSLRTALVAIKNPDRAEAANTA